jgi:hypothetical protein
MGQAREYGVLVLPLLILHLFIILVESQIGLSRYATFGDGAEYINLAREMAANPIAVIVNLHPPVYPLVIRLVGLLLPYDLAALVVNAFAQSFLIIPIYESAKLMLPSNHAKIALICSVFPPGMIMYSSIGLADSLTVLFSALFFYFLLKRNEWGMIPAAILAVLTHQIAYLLLVPLLWYYLRSNPKRVYRVFLVALPFVLLSSYMYFRVHNLLYYVGAHFVFSTAYWDLPFFSYPFQSLIQTIAGVPITAGGKEIPVSFISIVQVVFLLAVYFLGLFLSWRHRLVNAFSYGLPFMAFLTFYQVWFFFPRFLVYCFPLLITYGRLIERRRAMVAAVALACVSLASALYFVFFLLLAQ